MSERNQPNFEQGAKEPRTGQIGLYGVSGDKSNSNGTISVDLATPKSKFCHAGRFTKKKPQVNRVANSNPAGYNIEELPNHANLSQYSKKCPPMSIGIGGRPLSDKSK